MRVRDVMTRDVETCGLDDSLEQVAAAMCARDIGVLAILDRGALCGVITDRDVAMVAYVRKTSLREILVREAVPDVAWGCHPDDPVQVAEETMASHRVRRLPVVDTQGMLAGIVSIDDIARASDARPAAVPARGVVRTLAAVSAPRASV